MKASGSQLSSYERNRQDNMDRPLPCFASCHCSTATCSLSRTTEHEDCSGPDGSSLYCEPAITETAGDQLHRSSLVVTGVVATAKELLKKSQLVTGRIEHKILQHRPSTAAQKTWLDHPQLKLHAFITHVLFCKKSSIVWFLYATVLNTTSIINNDFDM